MRIRLSTIILLSNLILLASVSGTAARGSVRDGAGSPQSIALGTAFTYQGQLKNAGGPVNGACDFQFALFDAPTGVNQIGATQPVNGVIVSNGLFTVALDFGASAFTGQARWLEIAVRCPAGSGIYTTLTPRQALTAAPYALYAQNIPLAGSGTATTAAHSDHNHYGANWTGAAARGLSVTTSNGAIGNNAAAAIYGQQGSPGAFFVDTPAAVRGDSATGFGVFGRSVSNKGVFGYSGGADGVAGTSLTGVGMHGQAGGGSGIATPSAAGVWGDSDTGPGIVASSGTGHPIEAYGTNNGGPTTKVFDVANNGNVTADGTIAGGGADFAELLPAASGLAPGDVLIVDADGVLARSTHANELAVVGVYSTRPSFLGGASGDSDLTGKVPLAVSGIIPVKVSAENGAIRPGDLLVASSTPGHAMRAPHNPAPGTVIGKALGSLTSKTGVVKMLVLLR
jgi:hypothetical protein